MNSTQDLIVQRILNFDIDGRAVALPFVSRLCSEIGWTPHYAERVVREYKRFLVLAVVSPRPVTPSRAIDLVWHLHLTYTDSYWNRLCRDIIGKPLHHTPTEGGPDEDRKYLEQYERTRVRYLDIFGEEPPKDIWPTPRTMIARFPELDTAPDLATRIARMPSKRKFFALVGLCLAIASGYSLFSLSHFTILAVPALVLGLMLLVAATARPRSPQDRSGGGACGAACGTASCGLWDGGSTDGGGDSGDSGSGSSCGSSCGGGCGGGD